MSWLCFLFIDVHGGTQPNFKAMPNVIMMIESHDCNLTFITPIKIKNVNIQ